MLFIYGVVLQEHRNITYLGSGKKKQEYLICGLDLVWDQPCITAYVSDLLPKPGTSKIHTNSYYTVNVMV